MLPYDERLMGGLGGDDDDASRFRLIFACQVGADILPPCFYAPIPTPTCHDRGKRMRRDGRDNAPMPTFIIDATRRADAEAAGGVLRDFRMQRRARKAFMNDIGL